MTRLYSSQVQCARPIIPGFPANNMISSNQEYAFDVYATVIVSVRRYVESSSEGMVYQQLSLSGPVALCSPRWVSVSVLQSVSTAWSFCAVAVSLKVDSLTGSPHPTVIT